MQDSSVHCERNEASCGFSPECLQLVERPNHSDPTADHVQLPKPHQEQLEGNRQDFNQGTRQVLKCCLSNASCYCFSIH